MRSVLGFEVGRGAEEAGEEVAVDVREEVRERCFGSLRLLGER